MKVLEPGYLSWPRLTRQRPAGIFAFEYSGGRHVRSHSRDHLRQPFRRLPARLPAGARSVVIRDCRASQYRTVANRGSGCWRSWRRHRAVVHLHLRCDRSRNTGAVRSSAEPGGGRTVSMGSQPDVHRCGPRSGRRRVVLSILGATRLLRRCPFSDVPVRPVLRGARPTHDVWRCIRALLPARRSVGPETCAPLGIRAPASRQSLLQPDYK